MRRAYYPVMHEIFRSTPRCLGRYGGSTRKGADMSETTQRMNPLIATAAVAVIIFSAVGVGVMTGLIPSSMSKSAEGQATVKAEGPKAEPVQPQKQAMTPAPKRSAPADAPKRTASKEPTRVASAPAAMSSVPRCRRASCWQRWCRATKHSNACACSKAGR